MITVSTAGMVVSLKTESRFPMPGQQGHGSRNTHGIEDDIIDVVDVEEPIEVVDKVDEAMEADKEV